VLKPRAYSRVTVTLRFDLTDIDSVRHEAARRMIAGEADRLDLSQVVRDAIRAAPWNHVGEEKAS
jgi:hypothetical protein